MSKRKFFVLIEFGGGFQEALEKAVESGPRIKQMVSHISESDYRLVYAASKGDALAFVLSADMSAEKVRNLMSGKALNSQLSILRNNDSILVLEITDDATYSGHGFSKAWSWIQHR